jgi:hypothetical protein
VLLWMLFLTLPNFSLSILRRLESGSEHRKAFPVHAHIHTVPSTLRAFLAGTSLTQDVLRGARDMSLGVKIWDEGLQSMGQCP